VNTPSFPLLSLRKYRRPESHRLSRAHSPGRPHQPPNLFLSHATGRSLHPLPLIACLLGVALAIEPKSTALVVNNPFLPDARAPTTPRKIDYTETQIVEPQNECRTRGGHEAFAYRAKDSVPSGNAVSTSTADSIAKWTRQLIINTKLIVQCSTITSPESLPDCMASKVRRGTEMDVRWWNKSISDRDGVVQKH
jgi:hypothetical protein